MATKQPKIDSFPNSTLNLVLVVSKTFKFICSSLSKSHLYLLLVVFIPGKHSFIAYALALLISRDSIHICLVLSFPVARGIKDRAKPTAHAPVQYGPD